MADNLSQRKRDLEEIKKLSLEIQRVENDTAMSETKRLKTLDDLSKKRKVLANQIKEVNQLIQGRLNYLKDEEKSISSINGAYSKFKDSQKTALSIAESFVSNDEEKQKIINKTLKLSRDLSSVSPEQTKEYEAAANALNDQLELNKSLLAGNEELISALENQAYQAETISMASEFQKKQMEQTYEVTQKINQGLQTTFGVIRTLFSTVGGFVGTLAIGAGAVGKQLLSTQRELGGELLSNQNIATTVFSKIFPDAVTTTKSLSKEFGGLNDVSLKTQLNTNVMAKNLGVGTDEVASMVGSFARLNEGSTETAENLIVSTRNLAQANGLVPADVMADVANSAEAFAAYGKDGGTNIAEAAIAAGKLGVTMSQLTGITDNLLDFESSINSELELGAMLGRNINLDRARALAYEGNIGGAVRETLSSLGGIEEFNKMDIFQKREAAKLLGLSVDEFQKMAANADKLDKNGKIQLSQYEQMKETLKGMGEQAFGLLQGLGSAAVAAGQMGFNVKGIGTSMKGIVGGIGEKFKSLFGMDALSKARKSGLSDKQIGAGFGGKKAKDALAGKAAKMTPDTSVSDNLNKTAGSKGPKASNLLKGAAAILILAAALFVAAKAFQEFGSVTWPAVGMGLASLVGLAGIAYVLGKAQGEMIKGALAVAILGAALIPFAFSMNLIAGLDIGAVMSAAAGLVVFSAAIFGLGLLMSSGVGAVVFGAGLVALAGLGVSMMLLGAGLLVAAAGFQAIGGSMGSVVSLIAQVKDVLGGMFQYIAPIAALSLALVGLAGALTYVGVAGIAALPGLMAVAAVGTIAMGVGSLLGFGGDEGGEGGDSDLLTEIKGLRKDLIDGKVAVYLDGKKVMAGVSAVYSRTGTNSFTA